MTTGDQATGSGSTKAATKNKETEFPQRRGRAIRYCASKAKPLRRPTLDLLAQDFCLMTSVVVIK